MRFASVQRLWDLLHARLWSFSILHVCLTMMVLTCVVWYLSLVSRSTRVALHVRGDENTLWDANSKSYSALLYSATQQGEGTRGANIVGTCSEAADSHGQHQKVVSFVYTGDSNWRRLYLKGVYENAVLVGQKYPGWRMRVYHAVKPGRNYLWLSLLAASIPYDHVDLCYVPDLEGPYLAAKLPKMWRSLPAADPLVDLFISRDLDSRISDREVAAVAEWLQSNKTYHVMRDHPSHGDLVQAGMWGAKVHLARAELREAVTIMHSSDPRKGVDDDQAVMTVALWPRMAGRVLQHDAYSCQTPRIASHGGLRPYPTRRPYLKDQPNVVGGVFFDGPIRAICPPACRPRDHQDWTTC